MIPKFDISKIRKADKARSLQALYTTPPQPSPLNKGRELRGAGNGDPVPLYDNAPRDNVIPKIEAKYKNKNSKKRFIRNTYGKNLAGGPDESEKKDIEELLNTDVTKAIPEGYSKEWFNDFYRNTKQSQPMELVDKGEAIKKFQDTEEYMKNKYPGYQTDYNSKFAVGMDRERLQAINKLGEEYSKNGRMPTKDEIKAGILGTVRVDANDLVNYPLDVHYHPESPQFPDAFKGRNAMPSGLDTHNDSEFPIGDLGFANDRRNRNQPLFLQGEDQVKQFDIDKTKDGETPLFNTPGQDKHFIIGEQGDLSQYTSRGAIKIPNFIDPDEVMGRRKLKDLYSKPTKK